MKRLLFINSCIRKDESRTYSLAKQFLNNMCESFTISEINLNKLNLQPVYYDKYIQNRTLGYSKDVMELAKQVALANCIVVAAPFWDMSFPSALKVFFENVSIPDITFKNCEDGNTTGNCIADILIYITTRGMDIETGSTFEMATPYINSLCYLWGIKRLETIAVSGTDVLSPNDLLKRYNQAENKIANLCGEIT